MGRINDVCHMRCSPYFAACNGSSCREYSSGIALHHPKPFLRHLLRCPAYDTRNGTLSSFSRSASANTLCQGTYKEAVPGCTVGAL